jgi:hypothetical protein
VDSDNFTFLCICLRTSNFYLYTHYFAFGFCNPGTLCLPGGKEWISKCNFRLQSLFKFGKIPSNIVSSPPPNPPGHGSNKCDASQYILLFLWIAGILVVKAGIASH